MDTFNGFMAQSKIITQNCNNYDACIRYYDINLKVLLLFCECTCVYVLIPLYEQYVTKHDFLSGV